MGFKSFFSTPVGSYRLVFRKWPPIAYATQRWLMLVEFVGLIPLLVVFALSQPDLYRTAMWQIGYDNGFNSDPNMILYAYANHRPLPSVPLIWSSKLTSFNVAISVISLFCLLSKLMAIIMRLWYPVLATFFSVCLIALYTVSIYGQIGRDHADPDPKRHTFAAWYFRFGCGLARPSGNFSNCQMAQASLFITLYMFVIYLISFGMCIWAMWPNKANDVEDEDEVVSNHSEQHMPEHKDLVELRGLKTPVAVSGALPFTPRTQAFHTLNRDLPLRQHDAAKFG